MGRSKKGMQGTAPLAPFLRPAAGPGGGVACSGAAAAAQAGAAGAERGGGGSNPSKEAAAEQGQEEWVDSALPHRAVDGSAYGECPMCYKHLPLALLISHAATCCGDADPSGGGTGHSGGSKAPTTSSPRYPEATIEECRAYAKRMFPHLVLIKSAGDGDCFPSSVGPQIDMAPADVRAGAAAEVEEYPDRYAHLVPEEMAAELDCKGGANCSTLSAYAKKIAQKGVWMGGIDPLAVATRTRTTLWALRVWRDQETGQLTHSEDSYSPLAPVVAQHSAGLLQTPVHFDQLVTRDEARRQAAAAAMPVRWHQQHAPAELVRPAVRPAAAAAAAAAKPVAGPAERLAAAVAAANPGRWHQKLVPAMLAGEAERKAAAAAKWHRIAQQAERVPHKTPGPSRAEQRSIKAEREAQPGLPGFGGGQGGAAAAAAAAGVGEPCAPRGAGPMPLSSGGSAFQASPSSNHNPPAARPAAGHKRKVEAGPGAPLGRSGGEVPTPGAPAGSVEGFEERGKRRRGAIAVDKEEGEHPLVSDAPAAAGLGVNRSLTQADEAVQYLIDLTNRGSLHTLVCASGNPAAVQQRLAACLWQEQQWQEPLRRQLEQLQRQLQRRPSDPTLGKTVSLLRLLLQRPLPQAAFRQRLGAFQSETGRSPQPTVMRVAAAALPPQQGLSVLEAGSGDHADNNAAWLAHHAPQRVAQYTSIDVALTSVQQGLPPPALQRPPHAASNQQPVAAMQVVHVTSAYQDWQPVPDSMDAGVAINAVDSPAGCRSLARLFQCALKPGAPVVLAASGKSQNCLLTVLAAELLEGRPFSIELCHTDLAGLEQCDARHQTSIMLLRKQGGAAPVTRPAALGRLAQTPAAALGAWQQHQVQYKQPQPRDSPAATSDHGWVYGFRLHGTAPPEGEGLPIAVSGPADLPAVCRATAQLPLAYAGGSLQPDLQTRLNQHVRELLAGEHSSLQAYLQPLIASMREANPSDSGAVRLALTAYLQQHLVVIASLSAANVDGDRAQLEVDTCFAEQAAIDGACFTIYNKSLVVGPRFCSMPGKSQASGVAGAEGKKASLAAAHSPSALVNPYFLKADCQAGGVAGAKALRQRAEELHGDPSYFNREGVTLVNAHPGLQAGCPLQCQVSGLHAVDAGTPGSAVCAFVRAEETYYGTWAESRCAFNRGGDGGTPTPEAYACACVASPDDVSWAADPTCASGVEAAATAPGVCRVRMPGVNKPTFVVGWTTQEGGQLTCHLPNLPWGPGGSIINSVTGLGGNFQAELLCARSGLPRASAASASSFVGASSEMHGGSTPILPPGGAFVIGGCLALIAYALFILNREAMCPKPPAWLPLSNHSE